MRARWLALGLLLGMASIAYSQGGPGLFFSSNCSSVPNPVTGSTVCWQTNPPNGFFYWDGAAFSSPTLGGPYAPTSFSSGFVLIGGGAGPITATATPSVVGLTTTGQAALVVGPFGTSTGNTGELRMLELAANGTDYVYFKAPDAVAAIIGIIPPATTGTSGQCWGTNGANPVVSAWVACSPGAGSGITTLNALTAVTQTFANDTNVTITSVTSTHTLGWTGTLAMSRGGLGVATLALNGVVLGNGASPVVVSAAGAANTVFRVPGAGGTPAFGAVDVSQAAAITGLMRTANLGAGVADATTFLRGDQTYASAGGTPVYNYVFNSNMEVWGSGTATSPTGWVCTGTCAKDTVNIRLGAAAAAVTKAGGDASISQTFSLIYDNATSAGLYWRGQTMSCGVWARATVAGTTFINLNDFTGNTSSGFHTGGSAYEFLTVSRSISNVAAGVGLALHVRNTNTTSQFDGAICVLGSSVANWQPSGYIGRKAILTYSTGTATLPAATTSSFGFYWLVGNGGAAQAQVAIPMPFRAVARNLSALLSTAPGGADTVTFPLRVNEGIPAPQPTCVISAAAAQCSDVTNEILIAKGSRTMIRPITSATAAVSQAVVTIELEEVPEGL